MPEGPSSSTALDGAILTREELASEILAHTGDAYLGTKLSSGWGAVLQPLAGGSRHR